MGMRTRAIIYTRVSVAALGDTTKTDEQERLCRELCERRGWQVAEPVFTDSSRSAWRRDRKRPGWDAMLAAVAARRADAIVTYWGDRLVRQPRDLEDLLDLRDGRDLTMASVAGQYDFANPDHRMMMRWEVARACNESDTISRRKKAQYERMRRQGLVRPGGYRAFGFARDGLAHDPAEAAIVRELAGRVLTGVSLGSLVRDLNARGIPTTAGNAWSHTTLRTMLANPKYAGLMPDGVAPGAWEPVLDRGQWEQLRAVIAARSAGSRPPGTAPDNARRWLLSGIAECGACGAGLSIHLTRYGGTTPARTYSCKACRKVDRSQPLLDAFVTGRVLARLANRANPLPSAGDAAAAAELAAVTARRAEAVAVIESLADRPGESLAVLARSLDSFDARIAELRDRAGDGQRQRLLAVHAGLTPDGFGALDLSARRAIVTACYRIVVKPVTRKGPGFDPAGILMSPL